MKQVGCRQTGKQEGGADEDRHAGGGCMDRWESGWVSGWVDEVSKWVGYKRKYNNNNNNNKRQTRTKQTRSSFRESVDFQIPKQATRGQGASLTRKDTFCCVSQPSLPSRWRDGRRG